MARLGTAMCWLTRRSDGETNLESMVVAFVASGRGAYSYRSRKG